MKYTNRVIFLHSYLKSCKNFSTLASNRVNRVRLAHINSYLEAYSLPIKRKNEAKIPQI